MHNINYLDFAENTSEKSMTSEVLSAVSQSGDGYGTESIRFDQSTVCKSYDDAVDWINRHDRGGFYSGVAVRFYDYGEVKPTKKMEQIQERIRKTQKNLDDYITAHSIKNLKASFIGCPNCGSKLRRDLIKSECCPLCNTDLLSETTRDNIKGYQEKIRALFDQLENERFANKKNATIRWLVKYEYHS